MLEKNEEEKNKKEKIPIFRSDLVFEKKYNIFPSWILTFHKNFRAVFGGVL